MHEIGHFIGGKPVGGRSGRSGDVFNPNTGEVQAKVSFADKSEVEAAIANAEARAALAASRARIVAAADDARRRIERDLHDGAQQRLVTLALQLRQARATAPAEAGDLVKGLDRVAAGLEAALEELREIASGIHPAVLAEGGLRPALAALARRCPVPVKLAVQMADRLPAPVEIAAYYVVSEALTNTAKHANATAAEVDAAAGQEPPLLQDADRGTEVGHLGENVARHEDGPSHGVQLLGEFAELQPAGRVEPGGRLVQQQYLRLVQQRLGEAEPLPHAARQ